MPHFFRNYRRRFRRIRITRTNDFGIIIFGIRIYPRRRRLISNQRPITNKFFNLFKSRNLIYPISNIQ